MTTPIPLFPAHPCLGDTITWTCGGLTLRASIVLDENSLPSDCDCYTSEDVAAFNRGDWYFGGLVLSVGVDDICFDSHAASLWGIDFHPGSAGLREYLRSLCEDMESEAVACGNAALQRLLAKARRSIRESP